MPKEVAIQTHLVFAFIPEFAISHTRVASLVATFRAVLVMLTVQ
jgi:hypothetical protein